MNKYKMLHWRHPLSMTVRLMILFSIFILAFPISVRADNTTLTPNSSSYDYSDSMSISPSDVNADDPNYDLYVVPDTYDENIYQRFNFTFPSTTDPITAFELVFIYYGKKVRAKIELVIDDVVEAEIALPDAGNGEEVISQIDLLQWHEITSADLSTLEFRFLAEKKSGNGQTAQSDFVKLYISWGGQEPTPPPGNASGSVAVDGRLKLSEEPYSYYKRITHPQTPGDLYFYHDTTGGMCYYLLEVDLDFNDNVFSDSQTYLNGAGWNGGHGFGDLEESDNAQFTISDSGSTLYDFYLGYLGDDGSNWISGLGDVEGSITTDACAAITLTTALTSTTSLEWNLENTIYANNNSMDIPPGSDTWDSPALDYNYTNGLSDYWEFRMIYELGFPDDCGCGDADVADAHNSPSKHEQFDAPWASIGDYVWHDEDKDGLQDTGEYGLEGIVVQLYKETSGTYDLIRTSETDSRGWYEFNYLDGGDYGTGINYYVDVAEGSLPTGYSQTQITTQNRSNPPPDGDRFIVNLEPGDAYREADFGYADPPTAVTLVSFTARPSRGTRHFWPWLVSLTALAAGGCFWVKQRLR
jgi:hypothetical protein